MIAIALHRKYKEAASLFNDDFVWCYVGKDIKYRERISSVLGEKRRFFLGNRLQSIAEDIRKPFLDFIAALGRRQHDRLIWWSSKFASKSLFQSDFFLLLCYRYIVNDIIEEFRNKEENICLLIEDRWLYCELREHYSSRDDIRFIGKERLFASMAYSLLRGTVFRFLLVLWFIAAKIVVYYYHRGERPEALYGSRPAVAILSYPMSWSFKNGNYVDPYTAGLFKLFEKRNIPYFYLFYPVFPLSTARHIGKNKKKLWPLILDVRLRDILKRIFKRWEMVLPENVFSAKGESFSVKYLVKSEIYKEYADTGFNQRLVQFDALEIFFDKKWCRSIFYTFENQPAEKVLCAVAPRFNVRLIGYQHTSISKLYISHFLGSNEADFMPLPDRLLTTGSHAATLFQDGGMPADKVAVGGAWRYLHLHEKQESATEENPGRKIILLVALPVDATISRSILSAVFKTFHEKNLFDLWIKPHPGLPFSRVGIKKDSDYKVLDSPFSKLLNGCDVVITSYSTTGLEAYLSGKRVVIYIPENIIVSDPLMDLTDDRVYHWYEGAIMDMRFIKMVKGAAFPDTEKEKFFSKIHEDVWLELA